MKKLSLFNLSWWQILILLSSIGIITSTIFNLLNPGEPVAPISTSMSAGITSEETSYENIIAAEELESKFSSYDLIPIYQIAELEDYPQESLNQIIKQFSLKSRDEALWSSTLYSLKKDDYLNSYSLDKVLPPKADNTINRSLAEEMCTRFIDSYLPSEANLFTVTSEIKYYQGEFEIFETDPNVATWIRVPFSITNDLGLPTFIENQVTNPFSCLINSNLEVHKFRFPTNLYSLRKISSLKPLTPEETIKNINKSDLASFISASKEEFGSISVREIKSGKIYSAQSEYRIYLELELALPFYRFSGTFLNSQGEKIRGEIIAPAVATKQIE